jgi:hypothetical protein
MLSKKDKEFLLKAIEESVDRKIKEALTVKVAFEQVRDPGTGQPLAVSKKEIRDVYLPAFWVEFLPFYEGAIRGMQEQVCLSQGSAANNTKAIEAMSSIMLTLEGSIKAIPRALTKLKELADRDRDPKLVLIEHGGDEHVSFQG